MLLSAAAQEYKWNLNLGGIALMWRGGCIIRSRFLRFIKEAFDKNPKLSNLLLDSFFSDTLDKYQASLAQRLHSGHRTRRACPGVLNRDVVFRRFPHRQAARESLAGAARFLWRAYL